MHKQSISATVFQYNAMTRRLKHIREKSAMRLTTQLLRQTVEQRPLTTRNKLCYWKQLRNWCFEGGWEGTKPQPGAGCRRSPCSTIPADRVNGWKSQCIILKMYYTQISSYQNHEGPLTFFISICYECMKSISRCIQLLCLLNPEKSYDFYVTYVIVYI